MQEWPEGHFPNSKQLQTYLLFWERQRKPLEPDPGAGLYQKSFWLDPEDLDVDAYEAECFRGVQLDRAQFIRRIVATYHKGIPGPLVASKVVTTSGEVASPISRPIASTRRQAFRAVPTRGSFSESSAQLRSTRYHVFAASGSAGNREMHITWGALQAANPAWYKLMRTGRN